MEPAGSMRSKAEAAKAAIDGSGACLRVEDRLRGVGQPGGVEDVDPRDGFPAFCPKPPAGFYRMKMEDPLLSGGVRKCEIGYPPKGR